MASSTGLNRWTGRPLSDFDHVQQSIADIFTTRVGARIMRRFYGSFVPHILGQPLNSISIMRFYAAVVYAIVLWEPRFSVTKINFPHGADNADSVFPKGQNSPEAFRQGKFGVEIIGEYRPNALQGDFTTDHTPRSVIIV